MSEQSRLYKARWWMLAGIVALQVLILIISPQEATLGNGIKPVYLHVSLTWTGMILLLVSGILGAVILFFPQKKLLYIQRMVFTVGIGLYLAGFLISLYASWLNWGGIPYQEPRIRVAINVVIAGIAAWVLQDLVNGKRMKGLTGIIPLVYMLEGGRSPRMVLHPDNPVATSPIAIKATFIGLFVLALLLGSWLLWMYRIRYKEK